MTLPALSVEDLDRVVRENDTVFLSFRAPGCPACRAYEPALDAAAHEHEDVAFFSVDTHEQGGLASSFDVDAVPCLAVIRESVMVALQPGVLSKEVLEDLIAKVGALDMEALRAQMQVEESR